MGGEFEKLTAEWIFEEIIEFIALVKAKGGRIIVTFYGGYKEGHKVAVETLMGQSGQNVPIPWPGDRGSVQSSPSPPRVIRAITYRTINRYTKVKR